MSTSTRVFGLFGDNKGMGTENLRIFCSVRNTQVIVVYLGSSYFERNVIDQFKRSDLWELLWIRYDVYFGSTFLHKFIWFPKVLQMEFKYKKLKNSNFKFCKNTVQTKNKKVGKLIRSTRHNESQSVFRIVHLYINRYFGNKIRLIFHNWRVTNCEKYCHFLCVADINRWICYSNIGLHKKSKKELVWSNLEN